MDWHEIVLLVPTDRLSEAEAVAHMVVPYGIYTEDFSDLESGVLNKGQGKLIDEDLLLRDKTTAFIHLYIDATESSNEASAYISEHIKSCGIPFSIKTVTVDDKKWSENWKKYFKFFDVGEKLTVCPSWQSCELKKGRTLLKIDPGAAFGTGTHASTKLCLELLEKYGKQSGKMLDIGSGSGILSIAAALFGAVECVGVDIDSTSVKVSKENAEINGVSEKVSYFEGTLDNIQGKYDIICANIVADVIILLTNKIATYLVDDGIFICSGIIESRAAEVEESLTKNHFNIIETKADNGWRAYAAIREE